MCPLGAACTNLFTALAEAAEGQTRNRTLKFDRVNIAIAIPILEHVAGDLDSTSAAGQRALVASKRHHASPGYTTMIIAYAAYELETCRDDPAHASLLKAKARHLFAAAGHQYYFPSLPTIWPDIVGGWLEAPDRERLFADQITQDQRLSWCQGHI
ncbi:hypothetical protein PG994_015342 [Apiospora phragmitis]|uniref:Uncharacterized protein n=1 Tax=Apiospora phragmitis TaxID=2905665 RepID=A0ABR1SSZ0_9PEZI